MYENWKVKKSEFNPEEYEAVANWCNETGQYTIIDDGEYYRVIPVEQPEILEHEEVVEDNNI